MKKEKENPWHDIYYDTRNLQTAVEFVFSVLSTAGHAVYAKE